MADPDTLIAYLHPNEITATFQACFADLVTWDAGRAGHIGDVARVRSGAMGIPEARNSVVEMLLSTPAEWLFMVDADMGFARDSLDALRAVADPVERPVVGGLCFAQREMTQDGMGGFRCEARPTIFDYVTHPDGCRRFTGRAHYPVNAVTRCDATGAALLLVHRSVFERIGEAHGRTWFDRLPGADGLLGEDISFSARCGALGIPVHVHTGVRTTHFKHLWLAEADFWSQFRPPPATETVDVVVPVLHRPQNVKPLMESLRASTGLATAWFVCEPDDPIEWAEVERHGARRLVHPGTFAAKVNYAAGSGQLSAPWVLLAGDDVVFRPGWLDHAQFVAAKYGADVVGTNDLGNPRVLAGDHATHPMIRRSYVDEVGASWDGPGVVCHEGYRHWYVDDEIVTAAKQRGVWQMAMGSIVEHLHPAWGKADDDAVYDLGQSAADRDRHTFTARCGAHAAAA